MRVGWLDLSSGVAGDMLLAALLDAGASLAAVQQAVHQLGVPVRVAPTRVARAGLAAVQIEVQTDEPAPPRRTYRDVTALLRRLDEPVRTLAERTFAVLAQAEARVHGLPVEEVHFHEVGALDALADVVGVCAAVTDLGLDRLVAGPLALGGGATGGTGTHGRLPVPAPAVVELLRGSGLVAAGGPVDRELATPTGVALLVGLGAVAGPLPPMRLLAAGMGAGSAELPGHPNVVRVLVGEPVDEPGGQPSTASQLVLEANVDDLDPRAWPSVLAALLEAGADDAWLTPILMKKGRPAHTVAALVPNDAAPGVRDVLYAHTTTLGVRETTVVKHALAREMMQVDVAGCDVRVKVGRRADGSVANVMPEWDDVAVAARVLGRPAKDVLADAASAAQRLRG